MVKVYGAPKKEKKNSTHHPEAKGLLILALGVVLGLCLFSFSDGDPKVNWLGLAGYTIGWGMNYAFGLSSFFIDAYILWIGWRFLSGRRIENFGIKTFYFSIFLISSCVLLNLLSETKLLTISALKTRVYSEAIIFKGAHSHRYVRYNMGGVPMYFLYRDMPGMTMQKLLSDVGIGFTFGIVWLVSLILYTGVRFLTVLDVVTSVSRWVYDMLKQIVIDITTREKPEVKEAPIFATEPPVAKATPYGLEKVKERQKERKRQVIETVVKDMNDAPPLPKPLAAKTLKINSYQDKETPIKVSKGRTFTHEGYELPPLTLLTDAKKVDQPSVKRDLEKQAAVLEESLASFGIEAKVGEINCGPTITSFQVHPAIGVKVQRIKTLENDIALNLQAKSIRIIAPIPGKAAVGVEVPALHPQEVGFKEMLYHYNEGNATRQRVPILLGKTVSGDNVIADLTKMPHCLIAGATGSGKSVCINTIIMSILMTSHPDETKLILIDPKKVELTPFNGLPHMIAPVITEPQGAYAALNWLVKEMQNRYDILKRLSLRNISAFNSRKPTPDEDEDVPAKMPTIVMIIDEFADLMMTSSADLETPIARIAQMARAVGIHLILATQRPSREVITGLIKANFPTRIAFKVASRINSQIILDENGGESLLGNGDMLFLPPGTSTLVRAQGVFIRDDDINKVIRWIKDRTPTEYLIKSFDNMVQDDMFSSSKDDGPRDSLYDQAHELVTTTRTASTTFLQRKLKVGYARAASLMDELEKHGVISKQDGAKPRKVLYQEMGDFDE
ncbi:MAG: DNA translocase FtsK [Simkaniaceae bacterium]|nr:DNA translocase FtsK [Simkaniaceae bacterium]